MSDSSRTEQLLGKAEPVGDIAVSSVTACEREGKKPHAAAVRERSATNVRKTALQTPRAAQEEG